jgi:hypothetical protein
MDAHIQSTELPAPLTPPDCDLRGYGFMTLYGDRLLESDFWALANDTARCAGLQLWWAAWKQVPAGSLPNIDAVLCRLAGFDRNLKKWEKLKKIVSHGFVLCNDGRLYHKVVCEQALIAFGRKRKERDRKAALRAGHKETQRVENIENEVDLSAGQARDVPGTSGLTVQDNTIQDNIKIKATHSTEPVPLPARVASLNVAQGPNSSTEPAAEPEPVNERHLMPRASDPPHRWIGSGLSRGPDRQPRTVLVDMKPRLVAGKPGVNRVMVDHAARDVCRAGLYELSSRLDWNVLVDWLDEGLDLSLHIVPAINEVVEKQSKGSNGYKQPRTLRYFTAPIREYAARRGAAA